MRKGATRAAVAVRMIRPGPEPVAESRASNRKILVLPGDGIGPEIMREFCASSNSSTAAGSPASRSPRMRLAAPPTRSTAPRSPRRLSQGARQRCCAVRRRRRGEMGSAALRSSSRARHPASAQGNGSVRQSAAGGSVRCARRRVEPQARSRRRSRSDDRARADGRDLFRHAARGRDLARRSRRGHQHRSLQRGRDRARRPRRLRAARKRGGRVCEVDKANVMESGGLWREVSQRVRDADYRDVELSFMYADNCAMQLVRNPKQF